ncbi:MAG: ABC transporter ATP-binding protein [Candidatus Eremiobacteraeota bacterium]|nr:ABC transporter ATP-binding protein [Candidatus Eremiobacteraeota bacterium]
MSVAVRAPAGRLEVRDVSKIFNPDTNDVPIVEACSFVVEENTLTVMLGPSGCGKSTLINLIAGYDRPTSGEIRLGGNPVSGPDSNRLVVFQETALFPWMTIVDNIMFGPLCGNSDRKTTRSRAKALLDKVGLRDFADRYPSHLSGGMQRRAELARAIINQPALMLMDEPFRGLDAMTRELMQEHYLRLFEEQPNTNLFVTSEIEEAIFLGDRLLLMSQKPTRVKKIIEIDLPRPRSFKMLTSKRYLEIYEEAIVTMHAEASSAFAGTTLMQDMVEGMASRRDAAGQDL